MVVFWTFSNGNFQKYKINRKRHILSLIDDIYRLVHKFVKKIIFPWECISFRTVFLKNTSESTSFLMIIRRGFWICGPPEPGKKNFFQNKIFFNFSFSISSGNVMPPESNRILPKPPEFYRMFQKTTESYRILPALLLGTIRWDSVKNR